jgi:DNA polymerase III alpha subunit
MPDIDIDFIDRDRTLELFDHIPASRKENNRLVKHNTGVYLHDVPFDPAAGLCSLDYDTAETQGYFKIDLLNVGIYKGVRNEHHLIELMNQEPLWDLLQQDDFVNLLFHLNGHGDTVRKTLPTSIEQLAAVLAMIRPAKRHLIGKPWTEIMGTVWTKPDNSEYYFKKSHATAYAVAIVVQMNLICEQISYGYS